MSLHLNISSNDGTQPDNRPWTASVAMWEVRCWRMVCGRVMFYVGGSVRSPLEMGLIDKQDNKSSKWPHGFLPWRGLVGCHNHVMTCNETHGDSSFRRACGSTIRSYHHCWDIKRLITTPPSPFNKIKASSSAPPFFNLRDPWIVSFFLSPNLPPFSPTLSSVLFHPLSLREKNTDSSR